MDITVDMMDMNSSACDMMMHMNHGMMPMSFFFGYACNLLFTSFNLQTPGQLFGGIILFMVLAVLYEGLKTLREVLAVKEAKKKSMTINETSSLIGTHTQGALGFKHLLSEYCSLLHLLQSFLHVVQVGLGYILMLVVMTFNGWLFLAVCFGAGIGYFIFGKSRKVSFKSQTECCH